MSTFTSPLRQQLLDTFQGNGAALFAQQFEEEAVLPVLVPGMENPRDVQLSQRISAMSPAQLFGSDLVDEDAAKCVKSGLLLWNDDLETSHTVSQSVHTPTGSYWHGIMHRREPDYSNGKYWFRRVDEHPIYPDMKDAALMVADAFGDEQVYTRINSSYEWDPERFIDLCAAAEGDDDSERGTLLRTIQLEEIRLLLIYSYRMAVGRL